MRRPCRRRRCRASFAAGHRAAALQHLPSKHRRAAPAIGAAAGTATPPSRLPLRPDVMNNELPEREREREREREERVRRPPETRQRPRIGDVGLLTRKPPPSWRVLVRPMRVSRTVLVVSLLLAPLFPSCTCQP